MERWSSDINDWSKLSKDSAQLYINQAESRLSATENTSVVLTNSNDRLLGIATSIISVSLGYLFTGDQPYLRTVSFFSLVICIIASFFLLQNLRKFHLYTLGEEPKFILNSSFIDNDFTESEQYLNLVFQIMETIQYKIDQNHLTNSVRQSKLGIAKIILLIIPSSFLFAAFYQLFLGKTLVWI